MPEFEIQTVQKMIGRWSNGRIDVAREMRDGGGGFVEKLWWRAEEGGGASKRGMGLVALFRSESEHLEKKKTHLIYYYYYFLTADNLRHVNNPPVKLDKSCKFCSL